MSSGRIVVMIMFCIWILVACTQNSVPKQELTVSVAASLQDALTDIKDIYLKENGTQVNIHINAASSGTLRMQIEQGAPTDIFLSASEEHFNRLLEQNLIAQNSHVALLKNKLVLIAPLGVRGITGVESLADNGVERIAIGIPRSVPAGKYAKEVLVSFKIWDEVEGKIIPTKDVRQVLTYVETGNVDAGFVYRTDALLSDRVKVISVVDDSVHTPIVYPMGIVKNSVDNEAANAFYKFLQSEDAARVFEKYGFDVVD
jgi:molybdate transport system substrate-binding protein